MENSMLTLADVYKPMTAHEMMQNHLLMMKLGDTK